MEKLSNSITEFCYDQANSATFNNWYARFEDIFLIEGKDLDDAARVRLLMRKLNTVAYGQYSSYILPRNPRDVTFTETIKILKDMFGTQESIFSTRYKCLQTVKMPQEDLISYGARVNKICENFKLSEMNADEFKCLVFVCGLQAHSDSEVRMRCLSSLEDDSSQNINKLISSAQRLLNLKHDTALIEINAHSSVNAIKSYTKRNFDVKGKTIPKTPCWNCGGMHYSKYCNFANHICTQCKNMGHKEGFCKNQQPTEKVNQGKKKKNYKNSKFSKAKSNVVQINRISYASRRKYVTVNIKSSSSTSTNFDVKMQIDTASDVSIIGEALWCKMGKPGTQLSSRYITSASKDKIKLIAEFPCQVRLQGDVKGCNLLVVDIDTLSIFGSDWLEVFGLWDKPLNSVCSQIKNEVDMMVLREIKTEFVEVFQDSPSKCTKGQIQLHLKPNAKPIFRTKRPVAYTVFPLIEEELLRLETLGIITPVDYSEWAAPIVAVKKPNGKVRICGDYSSGLNDSLEPHMYPLHRPEDLYAKVGNSCIFTHIDLSDAYLQTEVSPESAKLLTINTHKGLYTFNRLAPGVKSAPGAFQQLMDTMLMGIDDTAAYIDDIIIGGANVEIHIKNVKKVLQRLREYNFHIKFEKCKFFEKEVKYLGNIMSSSGLRPDKRKIKAILDLPPPQNISELRSFLGCINYYGKYVHNMTNLRTPFDRLLQNNIKYEWSKECQKSFENFKNILNSDLLLTHYNPDMPIKVAADASGKGIGAYICHIFPDQSERVIEHASRTLTPAEKNYSQIEKEALGLVYAVKKFHKYIYGREFILCTDHKPLLAIFGNKNGIPIYAANRLQRWALALMMYNFKIQYINTKDFGCVDMLSRLIDTNLKPDEDIVIACTRFEENCTATLMDHFDKLPVTFNMVKESTQKCPVLQLVFQSLKNGWKSNENPELSQFYSRKENLCIIQNCLMYNDRIVIPKCLRTRIMKQLHRGHPGKERMKSLARSHVYWPGIDDDIVLYVRNCHKCAVVATSPTKHTLQSWPLATKPMERLHIDIAGPCNGQYYFVIVDAYSKWPEIYQVSNITSSTIIARLSETFARYGDCDTIVSDNGTQFVSAQFNKFTESRGIKHLKTAPYHPQSNGQAERFVRTLKQALQKLKDEGNSHEILEIFLQTYRSTPRDNTKSPAELFLQRTIKTTLDLLKPQHAVSQVQRDVKMENQFNTKHGAKDRVFKPKDLVYAQAYKHNKMVWVPGTIVEKVGHVNYNIFIYDGKTKLIRSHINQLKRRYDDNSVNQTGSIQLMLELFGIKPAPINKPHQEHPAEENSTSLSFRRRDEPHTPQSTPINNSSSPLTYSTPMAETPIIFSRQKRNRKPPNRFGFSN